jgi:hypothetical protein
LARRLRLVRLCQSTPEPKRSSRESELYSEYLGYVYLYEPMEEGKGTGEYKIGKSDHPPKWSKRSKRLLKKWNRSIITHAEYRTVIPFPLEQALHRYFDKFRVRREHREWGQRKNEPGESFRLPPEEVARFEETMARVEKWVLVAEEARLELEVMQRKAGLYVDGH